MKNFSETPKTAESLTMTNSRRGGGLRLAPRARFQRLPLQKRLFTRLLAFTLAEVLIVIGIIGIIADMTIPTLVSSYQEKVIAVKLKKVYSALDQAFRLAIMDNGTPDNWNLIAGGSGEGALNVLNVLEPYLKILKKCGVSSGCFPAKKYTFLNGTKHGVIRDSYEGYAKAILSDGTLFDIYIMNPACTNINGTTQTLTAVCGTLDIDVNGFAEPNTVGKDTFAFYFTKYGVMPLGTASDTAYSVSDCNTSNTGYSCAAWVIYKGNMDYLKHDVSW